VLALLALLVAPDRAPGQATPGQPTPGEAATNEWIRPEEAPARADELLRRLEAAHPDAAVESSFEKIENSLPQLDRDIDGVLKRVADVIEESAASVDLEDVRRELTGVASPLTEWKEQLAAEAKRVAEALDAIGRSERNWSETGNRPETAAAGEVVVRRVGSSIAALREADASLRTWRARVLATTDRVIDRADAVAAALEKLRVATQLERANLFVPDRAPLWSGGLGGAMRSELPRLPDEILAYARSTGEYIERDARPLVVQVLLAGLLMFAIGRLSARARDRLAGDQVGSRAARMLERPYAAGLLFALLASPAFHPLAPRRFLQLAAMLALFPAARIVVHATESANPTVFAGLFVVLLLDRIGSAVVALPALERATFLLSLAIGLGLAAWLSRRARLDGAPPWMRRAVNLAMLGLALAFLAMIGGWTNLGTLVGRGILGAAIAALYIYAAAIALSAMVAYGLASRTFRRSSLLERNTAILQRQSERVLRWLGAGVWAYFVLTALGLRSTAADALRALLDASVSVGALSLSVGGVLAFVLTILSALLLARIVNGVLEEDVFPRTSLPRGVPYALSTLARYGVYTLGLLFALAAAGVQASQVTIMVGGLGIGIGLGLQDLVKNFAAGLTLLLERRIQVGDTLELPSPGIFGRVLSIGTRASVVRTWSGAEVVVPNADLISSAVTNWTLSDRLCRIEVPVGVAYGTDPERVVALLLDAARSCEHMLADPAPQALFKGFGESSLDFVVRAWSDQGYDQALSLTSQLGLAVNRVLREAGITIPFPQRDLHLASISAAARTALSGRDRKD
jgi:potassium-dependent mechanosensitive channel